jgi:hypothetical protein
LNWSDAARDRWHFVQSASTLTVAVFQSIVCPPWQLTLEQASVEAVNDAAPTVFALYAARNFTSPGGTRSASFPGRALA